MDSLKIGAPEAPPASRISEPAQYILDAQARLRRLAESVGPVQPPPTPRETASNDIAFRPSEAPERVADKLRPRPVPVPVPQPAPMTSAEELRASVIDRVVETVAERVFEDWQRNAGTGNLSEQIAARIVERLLARLGE